MSTTLQLGDAQIDAATMTDVCRRYSVKELWLFGSAARREMLPSSDIDIMVEFQLGARIGVIQFESLVEELESLTGRTVDLVTKKGLKPWVRLEVMRDARILYAS